MHISENIYNNKYLIFLFGENNGPISARSASQISSMNLALTFLHFNFLIIGL